jgi:sterol desaturase/sphingolipid hydroxylase (fatty acid hydroxylase superfamily)
MKINYIALAVPVFFLLIGVELLVSRLQGKQYYRFNDAVTDMSCGIGQQVVGVFLKALLFGGYVWLYEGYALFDLAEWSAAAWIVAFVGVDLAYYWWHRLSHEVSFMWAVHVVHHQSEDYNLAVALRQAWFSGLTSWPFYAPLALVGVPPLVFLTVASFSTLYQFWIHTRTVGKLGLLEHVINTPSHHRVHHGRNPKYLDRNYGATLIVWDRLFGSFQEEEEEPLYGTVGVYDSWNPLWANFHFWASIARRARRAPRLVDKIMVWFMPPGWAPHGLEPHRGPDAADEPPVRYVTRSPRGVNAYVAVQFVLAVLATVALMLAGDEAPLWEAAALAASILAATAVWSGLFEGRWWAVPVELARLGLTAFAAAAAFAYGILGLPAAAAVLALAAASGFWAMQLRPPGDPDAGDAALQTAP